MKIRKLKHIIPARPASDGDGVKIKRIAGAQLNSIIDPFLMLDEINSDDAADYIGGFPEHPHRGMETITYMKAGRMRHRDHMGNEGIIGAGDIQWMTAGRGVLHSEMPEQEAGLLHGFQLWLNLAASEKLKPAAYQDIRVETIPTVSLENGSKVSVIAGEVEINQQALRGVLPEMTTKPILLDVVLAASAGVELSFNVDYPALAYVYKGSLVDEELISAGSMAVFHPGDKLMLQATEQGAELLLLSGKPLKEPIVQYGPFVMNTHEEINQAVNDFRMGRLV